MVRIRQVTDSFEYKRPSGEKYEMTEKLARLASPRDSDAKQQRCYIKRLIYELLPFSTPPF